jgi:hypothetical protein
MYIEVTKQLLLLFDINDSPSLQINQQLLKYPPQTAVVVAPSPKNRRTILHRPILAEPPAAQWQCHRGVLFCVFAVSIHLGLCSWWILCNSTVRNFDTRTTPTMSPYALFPSWWQVRLCSSGPASGSSTSTDFDLFFFVFVFGWCLVPCWRLLYILLTLR